MVDDTSRSDGGGTRRDREPRGAPGKTPGKVQGKAPGEAGDRRRKTPLTQQVGRVALVLLAVAFTAFVLVNRQPVAVDWVVATPQTPLILLLVVAFVIGAAIGAGLVWRSGRRRHGVSGE